VGWTLNYEILFYVTLAAAILVAKKWAAPVAAVMLAGVMFVMWLLPHSVISDFYSNGIMLEFAAGIFAYAIYKAAPLKLCIQLRPLLISGVVLSIAFLAWWEGTLHHGELTARRLFLGAAALVLLQSAVLLSKSGIEANWRIPVLLGDASYSLYLTHFFVVATLVGVAHSYAPFLSPAGLPGMIVALVICSLVGLGVHWLVDRPMYTALTRVFVSRRQKRVPVVQTIP
jgi:exopolysaccharide production protein ExoZ